MSDCTCTSCVNACKSRPGFFDVGEAEKAASLLNMGLPEFFAKYLVVDFWQSNSADTDTFLLAPAHVGSRTGSEAPFNPRGRCVFLTPEDRCAIHQAKPAECRETNGCTFDRTANIALREAIIARWKENHQQIVDLLGREPSTPANDGSLDGMLGGLLWGYWA